MNEHPVVDEIKPSAEHDRNKLILGGLAVLFVLVLIIAIFAAGFYKFSWRDSVTLAAAKFLPTPVATVAGKPVLYSELETSNLQDLIRRRIIADLAKKEGVVGKDDLENRLRMKVLAKDPTRETAEKVLREIDAGLKFEQAAALYSDDEESRYIGGEIGFFKPDELEPWIRDAVRELKIGETSKVIVTPEGFQILQIASKNNENGVEHLQLRYILIQGRDFAEYYNEQLPNYRVYTFVDI